jgi:hypothetical protein
MDTTMDATREPQWTDATRLVLVILSAALVLLTPSRASAQPLQSFRDLGLRVNLGDWVRIENQSGERIEGRVKRLTLDEVTISTDAGERRFTNMTVREVAVRRSSRRKGVLIGAGIGGAIGALAACIPADRSECVDGPLMLGALGAGVGLALSALLPRSTTVYPPRADKMPAPQAVLRPGPLDDVALHVNLDDRIRVEDSTGAKITGRLARLTGEELTIETDAGPRRFTAASVRAVAVHSYALGKGALIGAAAFTLLAAAAPACRSNPDCTPIAAAPIGAGVGLAVGALVPRMTTVYPLAEQKLSLSPEITRGGLGIQASLRW